MSMREKVAQLVAKARYTPPSETIYTHSKEISGEIFDAVSEPTPEMVEAGMEKVGNHVDTWHIDSDDLITIYKAMIAKAKEGET